MSQPEGGFLRRVVREPLVHFLIIGALVFAVHATSGSTPVEPPRAVIAVGPDEVDRLSAQFRAVWRRAPTESEIAGLVEDFVREEVYYREALALGLDRDDTVIRGRLRQKMEFLSEGGTGLASPQEAMLRAYFEQHPERFAAPAWVTFQQLAFGSAEEAVAALRALEGGAPPQTLGRPTLLPRTMEAASAAAVDGTFGTGFFATVAALPAGSWEGPVDSGYGPHLVHLLSAEEAVVPPFETVRARVEDDWRREAAAAQREAQYQSLRARYEVVLPEGLR